MLQATSSTLQANYKYDAFGRRIQKDVGGVIINYIYDGDQIIAEYDSSGNLTKKFIYGPGIDEPVCVIASDSEAIYFYHFDGLGSVSEISDSSGSVIEKYEYDAYGRTTIKDGNDNVLTQSTIGNTFGFTGRELDNETGLYYYRARYYSPELGRFLQADPLTWGANDPRILNLTPFNKYNPLYITGKSTPSLKINTNIANYLALFIISTRDTNPLQNINSHHLPSFFGAKDINANQLLAKSIIFIGQRNPRFLHNYLYCLNNPLNLIDPYGYFSLGEIADGAIGWGLIGLGVLCENPWVIGAGAVWLIVSPISNFCDEALMKAVEAVKHKLEERLERLLNYQGVGEP